VKKKTVQKKTAQTKEKPKSKKCFLDIKKNKFLIIGIVVLIILIFIIITIRPNKTKVQDNNIGLNTTPTDTENTSNTKISEEEFMTRYLELEKKHLELNNNILPVFYSLINEAYTPIFSEMSAELGLDNTQMNNCILNNTVSEDINTEKSKILEKIFFNTQVAQMIGVSGTPAIIVNGELIGGYMEYSVLKEAIDAALLDEKQEDRLFEENEKFLGDANAKIVVYIYFDYYCENSNKLAEESYLALKEEYADTGKIKLILRDFVTRDPSLAVYVRCAEKQNKFFDAKSMIFSRISEFNNILKDSEEEIMIRFSSEIKHFENEIKALQAWGQEHPDAFQKIMNKLNESNN